MRTAAVWLWARITEPKLITIVQTCIYAGIALAGLSAMLDPPMSVKGVWGPTLTAVWAWLLISGGGIGALTAPVGRWWAEKLGLVAAATGVLLYASIVLSLHFTDPGNRLVQLCFILVVLMHLAIRFLRIHRFSYEPGR
jgi:hypothetical protein